MCVELANDEMVEVDEAKLLCDDFRLISPSPLLARESERNRLISASLKIERPMLFMFLSELVDELANFLCRRFSLVVGIVSCTVFRRCRSRHIKVFRLVADAENDRPWEKLPPSSVLLKLISLSLKRWTDAVSVDNDDDATVLAGEWFSRLNDVVVEEWCNSRLTNSSSYSLRKFVVHEIVIASAFLATDKNGNLNQSNARFVGSIPLRMTTCRVSVAFVNRLRIWEYFKFSVGIPSISLIWSPIFNVGLALHAGDAFLMSSITGQHGVNALALSTVRPIFSFGDTGICANEQNLMFYNTVSLMTKNFREIPVPLTLPLLFSY